MLRSAPQTRRPSAESSATTTQIRQTTHEYCLEKCAKSDYDRVWRFGRLIARDALHVEPIDVRENRGSNITDDKSYQQSPQKLKVFLREHMSVAIAQKQNGFQQRI
jgi:hypothetical protein